MPYGKESGQLSPLRPLIDGMQGHNFALPDCLKFFLECMGEEESLNFWDIAALTGDTVAQVYDRFPSDRREYCVSGYLAGRSYMAYVFDLSLIHILCAAFCGMCSAWRQQRWRRS